MRAVLNFLKGKLLLLLICILPANSCSPTGPDNNPLTLSVEDVSCTEAWLRIKADNLQLPAEINLIRTDPDGGSVSKISILNTQDLPAGQTGALLYIDSLMPNKTYSFQAILQTTNLSTLSSQATATTLDTTSHNFTWQTFTFGGGGEASFINDVAIIDENNIWACGEIYLPDSLGNPDTTPYNVLHWDGKSWKPQKVTINFRGFLITPSLEGIFAFASGQIWLAGGLTIYGDGEKWTPYDVRLITGFDTLHFSKCWGVNPTQMYFGGMTGSLVYYNGQNWQRIESGTRTHINDAWGITNENNEATVYCPVSSFFTPGDKKILKIKNNIVDSVSWSINRRPHSVWTNSDFILYVCGEGIFENKNNNWKEINIASVASNKIRGNDLNDIFVIGDFGFAAHYNGISWKTYDNLFNFNSGFRSISVKENIVAIVGRNNGYGIVTIGRRN